MHPRAKTYGLLAIAALIMSYFLASLGVGDGTPMTVWYVLMSIGTGLTGVGFAIASAFLIFDWDGP
jgi:hypothetical protein